MQINRPPDPRDPTADPSNWITQTDTQLRTSNSVRVAKLLQVPALRHNAPATPPRDTLALGEVAEIG